MRPLRRLASAAIGLAAVASAVAGGVGLYAASLPPLDLAPASVRSPVVVDRQGRLMRPFLTEEGRWKLPVTHGDVDPRYLAMLKAYEDRRFDSHPGIDPLALLRATGRSLMAGRVVSGGSTLTMQVARLLEPRDERTLGAKLRQMVRAVELERRLSKDAILDLYLALAPFGGNLEGVRAASLAWFGKEPQRLSTAEAALLVALPQAPEQRRPDRHAGAAETARARVLARMERAGLVSADEAATAREAAIPTTRIAFPNLAPHLTERLHGERPDVAVLRLTLDARLQASLERLLRERLAGQNAALSGAMLVVDNATGEIRASVGGVDYFDAARAGAIDLTRALRSPGSALKPFIYALAFENGIAHPETMLEDRPVRFGLYVPENFDQGFNGMVSARTALQMSLNVPAVDLLAALGPQRLIARLRAAGAAIVLPKATAPGGDNAAEAPGLAVGLGGLGITLADLTRLYVGLARGGGMTDLVALAAASASPEPSPRLVEPVAAWYVADTLLGAPPPANAVAHRIAYKTGTSYGYRDAWAVGFDRTHTIGVWVGRADNGAVPGLVGRAVAAPILFDAFARLGLDPRPFPRPEGTIAAATSGALPPPLRHLRQDVPKTIAALARPNLKLAFPPDGARIDLGAEAGAEGERQPLALKIAGGAPPFTVLVNGSPVVSALTRRETAWTPDGRGFLTISVIDAAGASDSVSVRLQ